MAPLREWQNGNALVRLFDDGTRIIDCPEEALRLEWPLNIDVRVSTRCAFGLNPATGKAVCSFCHESARTDGEECDYYGLAGVLREVPAGTEIAIGMNHWSAGFQEFLEVCADRGLICNVTVNQGMLHTYNARLQHMVKEGLVHGVGVSYREGMKDVPSWLLDYPNTVVHVIAGIDQIDDVLELSGKGVKKVLVLGEKDFGFNAGRVDLRSRRHRDWLIYLPELFKSFKVVSFDNLALEQTKPQRFLAQDQWKSLYQGEHSFYINAVDRTFSPSSRSPEKVPYGSVRDYFAALELRGPEVKESRPVIGIKER